MSLLYVFCSGWVKCFVQFFCFLSYKYIMSYFILLLFSPMEGLNNVWAKFRKLIFLFGGCYGFHLLKIVKNCNA